MSEPCRMIMDVDPGIDDAMAIFYAVRRPGIKLEALTTTFGNSDTAITTENALRILELLGRPDIPVAKGVSRSLVHPYVRRADHVHGSNAIGDVALPAPKIKATDEHACDLIIRMAKENPGEIALCAVGPVTNVALALIQGSGDREAPAQDRSHGIDDLPPGNSRSLSADGRRQLRQ